MLAYLISNAEIGCVLETRMFLALHERKILQHVSNNNVKNCFEYLSGCCNDILMYFHGQVAWLHFREYNPFTQAASNLNQLAATR